MPWWTCDEGLQKEYVLDGEEYGDDEEDGEGGDVAQHVDV
jgi:hypothetical protein